MRTAGAAPGTLKAARSARLAVHGGPVHRRSRRHKGGTLLPVELNHGLPAGPLRIAMVIPPWYGIPPTGYGGIESMCAALVEALSARGHEVTVFGAGHGTGVGARCPAHGPGRRVAAQRPVRRRPRPFPVRPVDRAAPAYPDGG